MNKLSVLLCLLLFLAGCSHIPTESTVENSSSAEESVLSSNVYETKDINDDILNEFGLNYHQIQKKHGNCSDEGYWEGGSYFYSFENGYGAYFFGTYGETLPTENDLCIAIILSVSDFFLGMDKEYTFDELQSKYSLHLVYSGENVDFLAAFETVFNLGEYEIVLETNSPEKVSPNDWLYISKETTDPDESKN